MPPKVRELIADLERSGFAQSSGKGSHRKFRHPKVAKTVVISGNAGEDAKPYQVKNVQRAIEESEQ